MKTNISKANRFLLENLFWIVPLNFAMLLFMFIFSTAQRSRSFQTQEDIKQSIEFQIETEKKNQDSILRKVDDFRDLIKK